MDCCLVRYTNITQFTFSDIDVKDRIAVFTSGVPSFSITNSNFTNIRMNVNNYLISTGRLSGLLASDLMFTQISSNILNEGSCIMINYNSFDLSNPTVFKMNNVIVTNSKIMFINFNKAVNYGQASNSFVISNFEFSDSYFDEIKCSRQIECWKYSDIW